LALLNQCKNAIPRAVVLNWGVAAPIGSRESMLQNFFPHKIDIFPFFAINLCHFIVVTIFSYVTKWESLTAKSENEEKWSLVGLTTEETLLLPPVIHFHQIVAQNNRDSHLYIKGEKRCLKVKACRN
jgi:hypothetical protein